MKKDKSLLNGCVEDPRLQISGMTPNWTRVWGFTLIEVLVVVLIIAVLAAVALPQYQKAVRKSRFTAMMPIGKSMANSNEAYYLEHGEYASNPQELPVEGQTSYTDGTSVELLNNDDYNYTLVYNANNLADNNYVAFQKHSAKFADTTMCEARGAAEQYPLAHGLCASLGGTDLGGGVTNGFTAYLLSGDSTGSSFPPPCPENATCDNSGQVTACGEGYYIKNNACSTYEHVNEYCDGEGMNCDNSGFFNAFCVEGASCVGSTFSGASVCARGANCEGSSFGENTDCEAGGICVSSQFSGEAMCADAQCSSSTFSGSSICSEYASCADSTFRENAVCSGSGCDVSDGTTYEGDACCTTGGDCPPCS